MAGATGCYRLRRGAGHRRDGQDYGRGVLLLPPRPARLCDAARRVAGKALVLHGPVRGGDDRPWPDPRRRHAHRRRAHHRPARSRCRPRVRLRRARLPGRCVPGRAAAPVAQPTGAHHVGLPGPPDRDELIAYGPLLSDNGTTWLGTAVLVRAPDPDTARAILTPDRYAGIEVHNWQFGGRPS